MAGMDAIGTFASEAEPAVSTCESKHRRGTESDDGQFAHRLLHDAASATAMGFFPFRFRAGLLLVLVLQSIRRVCRVCLAFKEGLCASPNCCAGSTVDFFFELCAVVVLFPRDVAGNVG